MHLVLATRIVEARRALQTQTHLTAHAAHESHDAVPLGDHGRVVDRHEIDQLGHAGLGHEARDQYRRVGEVQLLDDDLLLFRGDLAEAATGVVEQPAEHAWRVEARRAKPVKCAVGGNQRSGLQIADQPVLGNQRRSAASAVAVRHNSPPATSRAVASPYRGPAGRGISKSPILRRCWRAWTPRRAYVAEAGWTIALACSRCMYDWAWLLRSVSNPRPTISQPQKVI